MNLGDLETRVQTGLLSYESNFTFQFNNFVKNAEEAILQKVEIYALRKNQQTNLSAGVSEILLPDDFLSPYSFSVGSTLASATPLLLKDESFVREAFAETGTTGKPAMYGLIGPTTAVLGPTPDTTYTALLRYYYKPVSLTVEVNGTWLSTNAERALELATKIEAYRFLKGDEDLMAEFKQGFMEAINDLVAVGYARPRRDTFRTAEAM